MRQSAHDEGEENLKTRAKEQLPKIQRQSIVQASSPSQNQVRDDERTRKTVLTMNIPDPETEPKTEFDHPSRCYQEVSSQRESLGNIVVVSVNENTREKREKMS